MSVFNVRLNKFPGFARGMKYPSIEFVFEKVFSDFSEVEEINDFFILCIDGFKGDSSNDSQNTLEEKTAYLFIHLVKSLHDVVGLDVFESAFIQNGTEKNFNHLSLVLPIHSRSLMPIFQCLRDVISVLSNRSNVDWRDLLKKIIQRCILQLKQLTQKSSNTPRFVRAAYEMDIPLYYLTGDLIQYGQGCRSRRMNSSFTDQTSQISTALARNKQMAAALMRSSGLPVARHFLVRSPNDAIVAAKKLGFPIVIKPSDMDGGLGVTALIESESEVNKAYALASQYSKNILVEEHIFGKDYRLVVMDDQLIWAIERVPGGVVGDGFSSIQELVNEVNSDPRRSKLPNAPLKPIIWDEEVENCLRNLNMTSTTILAKGQFIKLKRAANIALGGQPIGVFDQVHPDNRDLAIRAAQSLRLDLAGIDLLIPDISISWLETGAAICEVNAQPNIGYTTSSHLYPKILGALVKNCGRIPIIFLIESNNCRSKLFETLLDDLMEKMTVGIYELNKVYINKQLITNSSMGLLDGVRTLILNKLVQTIIIKIEDISEIAMGLPSTRFDLLVLNASESSEINQQSKINKKKALNEVLNLMLPACDGQLYVYSDTVIKDLPVPDALPLKKFNDMKKMLVESIDLIQAYK